MLPHHCPMCGGISQMQAGIRSSLLLFSEDYCQGHGSGGWMMCIFKTAWQLRSITCNIYRNLNTGNCDLLEVRRGTAQR
jgi:hypothetical protein